MSSQSIEESLVASVLMHKDSTGQMMNQVMTPLKMGITIMSSQSIEESLVASVLMHKESTGQMMNQVMTPFQQRFGKPCLCRATLSV